MRLYEVTRAAALYDAWQTALSGRRGPTALLTGYEKRGKPRTTAYLRPGVDGQTKPTAGRILPISQQQTAIEVRGTFVYLMTGVAHLAHEQR